MEEQKMGAGQDKESDIWCKLKGCENFLTNYFGEATVTVTIRNKDQDEMKLDIRDEMTSTVKELGKIPKGYSKTVMVKLEENQSLHCDKDGQYRIDRA